MQIRSLSVFVIVIALSSVPAPVAADAIVPSALASAAGDTANLLPFGLTTYGRYQQVYRADEFGVDMLVIDAVLFRPNSVFGDAFTKFFPSLQVNLSTTDAGPDGLSSTFADNIGADDTIVHFGPRTLSSSDVIGPGNTRAFDILIPFSVPFLYNPSLGNLLLDIRFESASGSATYLDAQSSLGDSVSRLYAATPSPTGNLDSYGLVTKFVGVAPTAVPEPASMFLLGTGLVEVVRRRIRKQRQ